MRRRLPSQLALSWEVRKTTPTKTKHYEIQQHHFCYCEGKIFAVEMISQETARPRFSLPKTGEAKFKHVTGLFVYWRATGRWTASDCGGGDGTEPFAFFLLVRLLSGPHLRPQACGSHWLVGMHQARPPHKVAGFGFGLQFKRSGLIRLGRLNVPRPLQDSVRLFESQQAYRQKHNRDTFHSSLTQWSQWCPVFYLWRGAQGTGYKACSEPFGQKDITSAKLPGCMVN